MGNSTYHSSNWDDISYLHYRVSFQVGAPKKKAEYAGVSRGKKGLCKTQMRWYKQKDEKIKKFWKKRAEEEHCNSRRHVNNSAFRVLRWMILCQSFISSFLFPAMDNGNSPPPISRVGLRAFTFRMRITSDPLSPNYFAKRNLREFELLTFYLFWLE